MEVLISLDVKKEIITKTPNVKYLFKKTVEEFQKANEISEIFYQSVLGYPTIKFVEIAEYVLVFSVKEKQIFLEYFISQDDILKMYF